MNMMILKVNEIAAPVLIDSKGGKLRWNYMSLRRRLPVKRGIFDVGGDEPKNVKPYPYTRLL